MACRKGSKDSKLFLNWKPSKDIMSKVLLQDPVIIDVIVHALIGSFVPSDSYTVASTEWSDASTTSDAKNSHILYIPQNVKGDKLMPILIVVQNEVNQINMMETIQSCFKVYEEYGLLPTVLIISIKDSSNIKDWENFGALNDFFLVKCKSSYWAQTCFVFFPDPMNHIMQVPSLTILCQFISDSRNKTFLFSQDVKTQAMSLTCKTKLS